MIWTIRPRSDFGNLAAIQAGEGPLVILLHGVGLQAEAWNAQIDSLASHFAVVAPDMAGHGDSAPLHGSTTLTAHSDLVASAIEQPALVVGHSMGAMIALDLAVRFPDKVRGVAALNAIYRRSPEAAAAVRERADGLDGESRPDPTGTLARWFGDEASPEAEACRAWLTAVDPQAYREAYAVFAREDGPGDADLAALACPALFCTGAAEPNSTPAMSRAMAELAPRGKAVVVPGAAHMMPMTHATEVNDILLNFFAECAS